MRRGLSGQLSDDDLAWSSEGIGAVSSDVPTPAFYDGDFFILSDVRKSLSRVMPATGEVKWTIDTPGRAKYEASPLAADGKIYLVDFQGEVAVIDAKTGKVINEIEMDEPKKGEVVRSSVVAAHGQLFIRTASALYAIGVRRSE